MENNIDVMSTNRLVDDNINLPGPQSNSQQPTGVNNRDPQRAQNNQNRRGSGNRHRHYNSANSKNQFHTSSSGRFNHNNNYQYNMPYESNNSYYPSNRGPYDDQPPNQYEQFDQFQYQHQHQPHQDDFNQPNQPNHYYNDNRQNNYRSKKSNRNQHANQNWNKPDANKPTDSESRPRTSKPTKPAQQKQPKTAAPATVSSSTRSEILTEQLRKQKYECMVCYQYIKSHQPIWSCNVCFHLFHLSCIKKWANSPAAKIDETASDEWRCPGCQTVIEKVPNKATCFCTKKLNPEAANSHNDHHHHHHNRRHQHQLAHSCGEVCGKMLSLSSKYYLLNADQQQPEGSSESSLALECKHKCVLICHPGPCPPCESMITRSCKCGKAKFQVKCSSTKVPLCDRKCEKMLNCGRHRCEMICHGGDCEPCQVAVEQSCHSHQHQREVKCGSDEHVNATSEAKYSCGLPCERKLACGNHKCEQLCHAGECKPCRLMPSMLTHCPCGQTTMRELLIRRKIIRTSCRDPVPTCDKTCHKPLDCHQNKTDSGEPHVCESKCHLGDCPPCERQVEVKCRCGKESETVKCFQSGEPKLCERRCQKKKSCAKHQCNEICCNDRDHICLQICNKQLNCGLHRCEDLCHKGPCKRCLVASFEERICHCGQTIQYPPIRCGTKPLECSNKCQRVHSCTHPVAHNCHWEEKCPPCTFLTSKMCMGEHEIRHNIPCYMKDVSCGKPCGKKLPNCGHKCTKTCHRDVCLAEGETCTQPCQKQRPHCSHVCAAPCHGDGPCPDSICQEMVTVKCKCGLKAKTLVCSQRMYSAGSVVFENLASQIKEMLSCKTIDVASFKNTEAQKKRHFELECDEECFLEERNRSLSQVLLNEVSTKPKPIYSDFLKSFARDDLTFALNIEKKFESLVNEMRLSKSTPTTGKATKSVNLPIMKQQERRFVHELAPYYCLETQSFDTEPYRNVCVYASREKCTLPSQTLTQSIECKLKQPAMPKLRQLNQKLENTLQSNLRVLNAAETNDVLSVSSAYSLLNDETAAYQPFEQQQAPIVESHASNAKKEIDYFDMTD